MIQRFARPQVCPRHKAVDLRVHHEARFPQVVHERLPHSYAAFRATLALYFGQRPAESIALFRKPGVADDDVGALATHVLDDIAARGPQVGEARHIGLQCKRIDAAIAYGVDEVEAVPVAAVEMDTDSGSTVSGCSKGQCLADSSVLPGARNQHSFASKGGVIIFTKFELIYIRRECHGACLLQRLRSTRLPQIAPYLGRS